MRGVTIHLQDFVEERQKRRSAKAAGFAVAAAVAGFLAGRGTTATAPPVAVAEPVVRVAVGRAPGVAWPAVAPIETMRIVSHREARPEETPAEIVTVAQLPAPIVDTEPELLTAMHGLPASLLAMVDEGDDASAVTPPHLCVSPKALLFRRKAPATERLTISNPGTSAVAITSIVRRSDRRKTGLAVDASGCERTILSPGESCTVTVSLRKRLGETLELWIFNDAGEPVPLTVLAPES